MLDIIAYKDGELRLDVSFNDETVWLNRNQISELLDRDVKTIGKHINNVYKDAELERIPTVANYAIVQNEGGRNVTRDVEHYNLDMIISVGYRVKSLRGVRFRQWATSVLKEYITNGYAVNREKITQQRLSSIENDVEFIKSKIRDDVLEFKEQVFFNGSYFDTHSFVVDLIKSAKKSITLVDNYIDNKTLVMLSNNQDASITLISHAFSKQLSLDIEKYNKQYNPLSIATNKTYHNRYLMIDAERVYDIGSSLKDSGHKTSSVILMSDFCEDDILKKGK